MEEIKRKFFVGLYLANATKFFDWIIIYACAVFSSVMLLVGLVDGVFKYVSGN